MVEGFFNGHVVYKDKITKDEVESLNFCLVVGFETDGSFDSGGNNNGAKASKVGLTFLKYDCLASNKIGG